MSQVNRTTTTETERVPVVAEPVPSGLTVAARVVYWILGFVEIVLGFRLLFALLGANPANAFANFVYTVSEPLARPFFSLFSYQPSQGISRLEMGTIVAMLVYAVIAWGIVKLLTLSRPANDA